MIKYLYVENVNNPVSVSPSFEKKKERKIERRMQRKDQM